MEYTEKDILTTADQLTDEWIYLQNEERVYGAIMRARRYWWMGKQLRHAVAQFGEGFHTKLLPAIARSFKEKEIKGYSKRTLQRCAQIYDKNPDFKKIESMQDETSIRKLTDGSEEKKDPQILPHFHSWLAFTEYRCTTCQIKKPNQDI